MTTAKRKAQTVVMDGYLKWARLQESDMDTKFVPEGQFNAEFYPEDGTQLDKIQLEADLRDKDLLVKDPYDGIGYGMGKWIKISRNNINRTVEEFGGPPTIVKMDDNEPAGDWDFETDGLIGNGSKVRVKVIFYGTGNLAGHRIEKIGVLDHIPYEQGQHAEASGF